MSVRNVPLRGLHPEERLTQVTGHTLIGRVQYIQLLNITCYDICYRVTDGINRSSFCLLSWTLQPTLEDLCTET